MLQLQLYQHKFFYFRNVGTLVSLSPFLETIAMYVSDMLTAPANLAGIPAISIPVGLSQQELSLGIQVMGNFF
jgi:aspartyl-tRNA(Asn)/glutamyl-tRNA(Gln) amidotransferase subunit A